MLGKTQETARLETSICGVYLSGYSQTNNALSSWCIFICKIKHWGFLFFLNIPHGFIMFLSSGFDPQDRNSHQLVCAVFNNCQAAGSQT